MKDDTLICNIATELPSNKGSSSPVIHQSSTYHFDTIEEFASAREGNSKYFSQEEFKSLPNDLAYGIAGGSTNFALADIVAKLEGGDKSLIVPSGLAAISYSFLAFLKSGDHTLISSCVYGRTKSFCDVELPKIGVEVSYYDPSKSHEIAEFIKPNTKLIFIESPNSLTFEVQDIDPIVAIAKEKNIITVIDNSWSSPLFFKPFGHGIDVSIQALSKTMGGHSDILMGAITTKSCHFNKLFKTAFDYGSYVSPFECFLAIRGIRSLSARMKFQQPRAIEFAEWLSGQNFVAKVLFPALPGDAGYKLWKKYHTGAPSLLSIIFKPEYEEDQIIRFINNLKLFKKGVSWGGFSSLVNYYGMESTRNSSNWSMRGGCVRFYVGLEDLEDLKNDIEKAWESK